MAYRSLLSQQSTILTIPYLAASSQPLTRTTPLRPVEVAVPCSHLVPRAAVAFSVRSASNAPQLCDAPSHVVWLALQDGLNGHFETYDPGCEAVAELRPAEAHTALAAEAARLRLAAA